MKSSPIPSALVFAVIVMALLRPATVAAQAGPSLLLRPWPADKRVQTGTELMFESSGDIEGGPGIRINVYESEGRVLILPDERQLAVGYEVSAVDIHTTSPLLPDELIDHSIAVGLNIARFDDWRIDVVGGVGYNGNDPYSDGEAWYGRGDIIATRKLDEVSFLQLILDYNGNRSIFPDVPLPAVSYSRRWSEALSFTVGVPYSSLTWTPDDHWTIEVSYTIPVTIDLLVDYELAEGWHLFGAFRNRLHAYRLFDGDLENRRVFFTQRRVEGGVRWEPRSFVMVKLAVGFAFGQEFERGFDIRDTTTVAELSSEPYVALGFELRF